MDFLTHSVSTSDTFHTFDNLGFEMVQRSFTYLCKFKPELTGLTWEAKLVGQEGLIAVKFTRKCNQDVHTLWAKHQFGPVLHYFGD